MRTRGGSTRTRRGSDVGGPRSGLPAVLSRSRVALRIARRTSLRSVGRSTLIAAMVALPVAGLASAALVVQSTIPSNAETLTVGLGQTEARVQMVSAPNSTLTQTPFEPLLWQVATDATGTPTGAEPGGVIAEPAAFLPAGTRILPIVDGLSLTAETKEGIAAFPGTEGEVWDESFAGRYDLVAGRAPRTAEEVAVTPATLPRLGVELGGTVRLLAPAERSVTVVGLVDEQTQPDAGQAFFMAPGALTGHTSNLSVGQQVQQTSFYLPDTPLSWRQVQELNKQGAIVLSRDVFEHPPVPGTYRDLGNFNPILSYLSIVAAIGGFAVFEIALLAGAAFMVGARQQQRSLATVASVGANRSTLFSIVTSSGLVLGLVGGLAGIAIGIGGGALFMQITDDGNATQYWGFHLSWPMMAAILAFAVVVGWLAAIVPAINASRIDVVSALRGARRPAPPRRRRPIAGLILVLGGIALTLAGGILMIVLESRGSYNQSPPLTTVAMAAMVVGPIVAQLGLVLCSGLLLRGGARLLSRVGIGARLASRDAARNTGRSVPALAAIMTTVFAAIVAMTMIASFETSSRDNYQYSTMPGQMQVDLTYWDPAANGSQARYDKPEDFANVLRTTAGVDTVRVLQTVPNIADSGFASTQPAADADALLPLVSVPPPNLCPNDPRSPDYKEGSQAARDDWRCGNAFSSGYGGINQLLVGDSKDLALVLGRQPSEAAIQALATGGAVSLYPQYIQEHSLNVSWWTGTQMRNGDDTLPGARPTRTESLSVVIDEPTHAIHFGVFVSPSTADRLGIAYEPSLVLASTTTPPNGDQLDALHQQLSTLTGVPSSVNVSVELGPQDTSGPIAWGLLALSSLIAIAAAAVAIGLARFDGRQDDATLSSIGSSPLVRRNFTFWQALVLAGIGAVLGGAVGLLPAIAFTLPGAELRFAAPWLQIATTVVGLPLVIACGSWLLARRSKVAPRRVTIG